MPARLRFTTGAWAGRDVPLPEPEARIGRDPIVNVLIPAADQRFVSRVHAAIIKDGARYVAQDLESSNGTWVNGERIQRITLTDGDEIQFGRQGPIARFYSGVPGAAAVAVRHPQAAVAGAPHYGSAGVAAAPGRAPAPREAASQLVRRLVNEAIATSDKRSRTRVVAAVAAVVIAGGVAAWAAFRFGIFDGNERAFRQLADDYQERVVLVEVGIMYDGRFVLLGNGSGFFAADGGYLVTNKHVIYSHLYEQDSACLAESFRRKKLPFQDALIITVWSGGSQFRQTPTTRNGDRGLGFSTEHKTLSIREVAPDNLLAETQIGCEDAFGGPNFVHRWRRHAQDNNDLAVLRATKSVPFIPLAGSEPGTDDPVMVYGFPTGTVPLETNRAEPIRRVGRVLRTRETIQIDAVVLGGNSGGPLIDVGGNVVGITTRGTAESLNMAIKVEYAKRLLDRARAQG